MATTISSVSDGALVEVELPAVIAEDPEGRTVGDCKSSCGAIGGERYILCQLLDVKMVNGRGAWGAAEQHVDGLLAVEDTTGTAELFEVIGKQRYQSGAVSLAVGVEEPLFEGVEMVLQLGGFHMDLSSLQTVI